MVLILHVTLTRLGDSQLAGEILLLDVPVWLFLEETGI